VHLVKRGAISVASLAIGMSAAFTATAATQEKVHEFSAADACQTSMPTSDGKVQPGRTAAATKAPVNTS
jgi:hypothetical protein